MTCYIVVYMASQVVFDDRLMNLLPMSIYLATKVLNVNSYQIQHIFHILLVIYAADIPYLFEQKR